MDSLQKTPKPTCSCGCSEVLTEDKYEAKTLKILLGLNALMFFLELGAGLWAKSMGLIADSLDMFADAAVYGIALYAVGKAVSKKIRAAKLAGFLQILLAVLTLVEAVRRFLQGDVPEPDIMMIVALLALLVNACCLYLLFPYRSGGAHMKASYIFSVSDVLANMGVIGAGVLVYLTQSIFPDLIVGVAIGIVVLCGGVKILRLR